MTKPAPREWLCKDASGQLVSTIEKSAYDDLLKSYRLVRNAFENSHSTKILTDRSEFERQFVEAKAEIESLRIQLQETGLRALAGVKSRDAMTDKLAEALRQALDFIEHPPAMSTGDRMWHQDGFVKACYAELAKFREGK